ncbi:MAG: hypothetical protein HN764_05780 [Gammaproteobacteria bacterium]|jgi:hypothetical protein|nr:hypothetical protein [Gammaproteobacteria bacterium]
MFSKKSADNTAANKIITEGKLLDNLCELATERHFQEFLEKAHTDYLSEGSADEITVRICEALVKDLENEIWQRIAPNMLERVKKTKELAMEATGGHKII